MEHPPTDNLKSRSLLVAHGIFSLFLIAIMGASVYAQQDGGRFAHLKPTDGLSDSTVRAILQDTTGFIWLGTQGGLDRYDGKEIRHYQADPSNPNSPSGSWIQALFEDSFGILWIGTRDNGLNYYDPTTESFKALKNDPNQETSVPHDRIWSITEDRHKQLWVGTKDGMARLDLKSFYTKGDASFKVFKNEAGNPNSLAHNEVNSIVVGPKNHLWIGTHGGGISIFDPVQKQFQHIQRESARGPALDELPSNRVKSILIDSRGLFWVGTRRGLATVNPKTYAVQTLETDVNGIDLGKTRIFSLCLDRDGEIWAGTSDKGLFRISPSGAVKSYWERDPKNLDEGKIESIYIPALYTDRTGLVWVGSGKGVYRFYNRNKPFQAYKAPEEGPELNGVHSLYLHHDNSLWIGSWGKGLIRHDRDKGTYEVWRKDRRNPKTLPSDYVFDIDGYKEQLWLATRDGLSRMNLTDGTFFTYNYANSGISGDNVSVLYRDSQNKLWAGTWGRGLNIIRQAQGDAIDVSIFRADTSNPKALASDEISCILEDLRGTIWIGTPLGLSNIVGEEIHTFANKPGQGQALSHNHVETMIQDKKGRLWFGTLGGGLNLYHPDTGRFERVTKEDGLVSDFIKSVAEDDQGNLWVVSSNSGICRYNHDTKETFTYREEDGLISNLANKAFFKSALGEIFVGGPDGITSFFPQHIKNNQVAPNVALTDFTKFNKKVSLPQSITVTNAISLGWKDTVFAFEFASLDYTVPHKNKYAYKLDGLNNDWIGLENTNSVSFTGLEAGRYTLRIKGSNNDGIWSTNDIALQLRVAPPPWRHPLAYLFYFLVITGAAWLYIRNQKAKLEQERYVARQLKVANDKLKLSDRIKDQFLANTSHELRTPLNGMIGIADSMYHGATGTMSELQKDNLSLIVTSGQRLAKLVDDILDFSRMRRERVELHLLPVDLYQAVETVIHLTQPLAKPKGVALINNVSQEIPQVDADPDRLRQILHNLIGNAAKFTEEGSVEVSSEMHGEMMTIHVKDTGIGISQDAMERIFESFEQADGSSGREHGGTGLGLAITKSLVELHGGDIIVTSTPGEGSIFSFTLNIADVIVGADESEFEHDIAAPDEESEMVLAASTAFSSTNMNTETHVPERVLPKMDSGSETFRILLVDDEPVNLQVLRNMLCRESYELIFCASGFDALEQVARETFDLILLDVMMPRMSGFECCTKIREKWAPDELPIIMLTAKNQVGDVVTGFEVGANDYVVKPVSQEELLVRLRTHLKLLQTTRKLRFSMEKLEEYSHILEEKVHRRTLEIQARNEELEALDEVVKTINQEVKLTSLLSSLLQEAHILLPHMEKGFFMVQDEASQMFKVVALDRHKPELLNIELNWEQLQKWFSVSSELTRSSIHITRSFDLSVGRGMPTFFPTPKSALVMTILVHGKVEGFMVLENFTNEEAFQDNDLHRLGRLQAHAVSAIVKSRMLEEVKQKNDALMKAHKQLIMQEKMAYLGNLTAGVAHELRNPLNFVNNFAAVAVDMTKELRDVIGEDGLEVDGEEAVAILEELEQNTALIYQHGKRADRVVKSMMMHSKQGAREQHPVDINTVVEEQYELAFHAIYALGNSVDITVETDFEKGLESVVVVPQDLSRALLNILSNSIYALIEKRNEFGEEFSPLIRLETRDLGSLAQIKIYDNGTGIAPQNIDKIFTPFFTTRPTGEGIGLGLSICYDIIVQGHHGTIEAKSVHGEFSEFTIKIPNKSV